MSDRSAPRLETAIKAFLAPALRDDKFVGSGRTYRRTVDGLIQVVNVQGSRYGGSFAINLACHPVSIPDVVDHPADPKRLTESLCEFRRRLAEGNGDKWWDHDGTAASMEAAVRAAVQLYVGRGRQLLDRMVGTNGLVARVTASQLDNDTFDLAGFASTKVRMALALSRLRKIEGRLSEARDFAMVALKHLHGPFRFTDELRQLAGMT
jgi:hypothetical protein